MNPGSIEPMDRLIFGGIIFFTMVMLAESHYAPSDGQTFQVLCSCLSGLMGAFLARIKPTEKKLPPDSKLVTQSTSTVVTAPNTEDPPK